MPVANVNALLPSETATASESVVLQLAEIEKQYPGVDHPAVTGINLSLMRGEILSLLGPSGCGKTTLLRIVAGFEQAQTGEVFIEGQPMTQRPPEKRGVGMVFQDYALFPHLTVQQNIAFGLQNKRRFRSRKQQGQLNGRIQETLNLVGLEGFESRYPHELSGGQQQRIALARALAPAPSLVLLDEPMSNLDVQVRLRLRQELREILKRSHTTAILVTHDQEEALSVADRIAVMRQGHVEQYGFPEEIYQRPATQFVADFVTQANFLPAKQRDLELWETEIGCFQVRLTSLGQLQPEQQNLGEMMLRQEDILLVPLEGARAEEGAVVCDRQFLGREHRYNVRLASGRHLLARMPASQAIPVGTTVDVTIAQHRPQVFIDAS